MVALFSATQNSEYDSLKKQIQWTIISIPVMIILIILDYNTLVKISPFLYGIGIIALIGVLFTEEINGATSWFQLGSFSVQPAEFAKLSSVLLFSYVISIFQKKGRDQINKFWKLLLCVLVMALPVALIILQPDYGTAGAFVLATAFVLFIAGIKVRYIIACILIVAIALPLLYIYVLPEHAKQRIDIFLNPESDARGAGYNIIQSKLAIGAGQLWGMGLLKGNQTQLRIFVP